MMYPIHFPPLEPQIYHSEPGHLLVCLPYLPSLLLGGTIRRLSQSLVSACIDVMSDRVVVVVVHTESVCGSRLSPITRRSSSDLNVGHASVTRERRIHFVSVL